MKYIYTAMQLQELPLSSHDSQRVGDEITKSKRLDEKFDGEVKSFQMK